MDQSFKRASGLSLIIGSLLLTLTMILHPSGGSIEHILHVVQVNMISHSLAIASLPFIGFGYYGVATALLTKSKISILALAVATLGLVAAMMAGTINGLTLSLFLQGSAEDLQNQVEVIKAIMRYGFAINRPMDYILIGAFMLSMGIWSVLILRTTVFPKWLAYLGLGLVVLGILGFAMRFDYIHLGGFRAFIFSLVGWIVGMGVALMRK